jgi:hypothetical protein
MSGRLAALLAKGKLRVRDHSLLAFSEKVSPPRARHDLARGIETGQGSKIEMIEVRMRNKDEIDLRQLADLQRRRNLSA